MRERKTKEIPDQAMTPQVLRIENANFLESGGVSSGSSDSGFLPAFLDTEDDAVYFSRYGDGRLAPFHLLDGLPEGLVLRRNAAGTVEAVKPSVVSGFVRAGRFYGREEAALEIATAH
jgi:hypothetical protein